jgi:hypothetical protein
MPGDDFSYEKGLPKRSGVTRSDEVVDKTNAASHFDYHSWLGLGLKATLNPKPRFRSEDDLWS